jgi:hypothetical protein
MKGFNPSRWAIEHRSLAWYLMLVCLFAGAFSYLRLARDEDPPFTVKTMVVRTLWPGATLDDTIEQVTDRIEKKRPINGFRAPATGYEGAGGGRNLVPGAEKGRRHRPEPAARHARPVLR